MPARHTSPHDRSGDAKAVRDLAALRWLQSGESVILHGTVGVGKTHIATAMGHLAIRRGAEVRFTKTSRTLAELAGGRADGTWTKRLRDPSRPDVLIPDDSPCASAPPPRPTTSTNSSASAPDSPSSWPRTAPPPTGPLLPNPLVTESVLDRLINNSHQRFMNGPSYRPNKRPKTGPSGARSKPE